jgi:transcriptional regulator with XRE-family HTH domain
MDRAIRQVAFVHESCNNPWTVSVAESPLTRNQAVGRALRAFLVPAVRPSDLARQAGVSRQYVSDVLLGKRPASERLIAAAAELGLPIHLIVPTAEVPTESAKPAVAGLRAPRNNNRDREYTPLRPAS